jgi:hypothetical protein
MMGRVERETTPGSPSTEATQEGTAMTNGLIDATRSVPPAPLSSGTRVDVRNRFVGAWSHGFEVAEHVNDGYRVRRLSDDSVLPDVFPGDDVRPERRKPGLWWY